LFDIFVLQITTNLLDKNFLLLCLFFQLNHLRDVTTVVMDETFVPPSYPSSRRSSAAAITIQQEGDPQPGTSGEPSCNLRASVEASLICQDDQQLATRRRWASAAALPQDEPEVLCNQHPTAVVEKLAR
jgi:hypothetical protein